MLPVTIYVQPVPASVCKIPSCRSLPILLFQRTHPKFMASALQQVITEILQNNYITRMFIDLGASGPLILVFFLVLTISAVGYDYSKQYVSVCIFSRLTNFNIVSPHILRRGMPPFVGMIHVEFSLLTIFVDRIYMGQRTILPYRLYILM